MKRIIQFFRKPATQWILLTGIILCLIGLWIYPRVAGTCYDGWPGIKILLQGNGTINQADVLYCFHINREQLEFFKEFPDDDLYEILGQPTTNPPRVFQDHMIVTSWFGGRWPGSDQSKKTYHQEYGIFLGIKKEADLLIYLIVWPDFRKTHEMTLMTDKPDRVITRFDRSKIKV